MMDVAIHQVSHHQGSSNDVAHQPHVPFKLSLLSFCTVLTHEENKICDSGPELSNKCSKFNSSIP